MSTRTIEHFNTTLSQWEGNNNGEFRHADGGISRARRALPSKERLCKLQLSTRDALFLRITAQALFPGWYCGSTSPSLSLSCCPVLFPRLFSSLFLPFFLSLSACRVLLFNPLPLSLSRHYSSTMHSFKHSLRVLYCICARKVARWGETATASLT